MWKNTTNGTIEKIKKRYYVNCSNCISNIREIYDNYNIYKDKLNGVGGLFDNIIKSSNNLGTQLGTLKSTLQGVSSSTYNLQDTLNSISSSSKTEKEKDSNLQ